MPTVDKMGAWFAMYRKSTFFYIQYVCSGKLHFNPSFKLAAEYCRCLLPPVCPSVGRSMIIFLWRLELKLAFFSQNMYWKWRRLTDRQVHLWLNPYLLRFSYPRDNLALILARNFIYAQNVYLSTLLNAFKNEDDWLWLSR